MNRKIIFISAAVLLLAAAVLTIVLKKSREETPAAPEVIDASDSDDSETSDTSEVSDTPDSSEASEPSAISDPPETSDTAEVPEAAASSVSGFLRAEGSSLIDENGAPVLLQGVNLGNYFVQEFWMGPTAATENVACQKELEETLVNRFGTEQAEALLNAYLDHYITEEDLGRIQALGLNCIRLPLWYGTFTDAEGNWKDDAFLRTDRIVEEAASRGLYVILDMHGAYGSQNGSDHSGIDGREDKLNASGFFFGDDAEKNQELYYRLWERIAEHYRDNPAIAGYDLLNEPFCTYRYDSKYSGGELHNFLYPVYDAAYQRIRAIDDRHIIIMEAVWDASDLPNPQKYGWKNVMYEYHNYEYSDYDNEDNRQINSMKRKLRGIRSERHGVPSLMGEFNYFNSMDAWTEGIRLLREEGISWTFWSYKCMKDNDNWGIMRLDIPRVNPEKDSYEEILEKWSRTGDAEENLPLTEAIRNALK